MRELENLFGKTFGGNPESIYRLPQAGSHREYFRIISGDTSYVGVHSPDPLETTAFLSFTRHFLGVGLNVPEILAEDMDGGIYLLQDLGDLTLKKAVDSSRAEGRFPEQIIPFYRQALEHLVSFQVMGHKDLDYSVCVPRQEFDRQSVMWDLNHFKYFFLKLLGMQFDEQALEDDFRRFAGMLSQASPDYFMYRDFNARNIMITGDDLYFVDYQGGRRGPLQYDVASLLFESRVALPPDLRSELLDHYLDTLDKQEGTNTEEFRKYFHPFVLVRILQVLGAYGIRGIHENKALFLQSIPFAIKNIEWMIDGAYIPDELPELSACLARICMREDLGFPAEPEELTVKINSFSYKKGFPRDMSGNGGGFVFDCRALPNPGREEKYRPFTGKDKVVVKYLEEKEEVKEFLDDSFRMVKRSVEEYGQRGFSNLMVSYGCTGGQHRSVYCAERMKEFLENELKVKTELIHKELE